MARLPYGKQPKTSDKDKYTDRFINYHEGKNRPEFAPPKNCTWCEHRIRDFSEDHEREFCGIHGHELPNPSEPYHADVEGCGTCNGRWCPRFEPVDLGPKKTFSEILEEYIERHNG